MPRPVKTRDYDKDPPRLHCAVPLSEGELSTLLYRAIVGRMLRCTEIGEPFEVSALTPARAEELLRAQVREVVVQLVDLGRDGFTAHSATNPVEAANVALTANHLIHELYGYPQTTPAALDGPATKEPHTP